MNELLKLVQNYFTIEELVDEQVYKKYGARAWRFFDIRLLQTILHIRVHFDAPITVNNWHVGGKFSQRGLRTNVSSIVQNKSAKNRLYLSAHVRGAALDFDVKGYTAVEVRKELEAIAEELPYKIRLERNLKGKPISWVHLDIDFEPKNPKVYLFDV